MMNKNMDKNKKETTKKCSPNVNHVFDDEDNIESLKENIEDLGGEIKTCSCCRKIYAYYFISYGCGVSNKENMEQELKWWKKCTDCYDDICPDCDSYAEYDKENDKETKLVCCDCDIKQ